MFTKMIRLTVSVIFAITMTLCMMPQSVNAVATEAEQTLDGTVWMETGTYDVCLEFLWWGKKYPNKTNSHWKTYHTTSTTPPSHPFPHTQYITFSWGNVDIIVVDYC